MKYLILISSLFFTVMTAQAQTGSWKIKLNNKLLLSTSREDEKLNSKKIKLADWKKAGMLEISFKESEPDFWWRSFLFYDEQDNELHRKDSTTLYKIPLATLRKIFNGKKEIRIYTTVAPKDPNFAVRIRRVHLCTLRLP